MKFVTRMKSSYLDRGVKRICRFSCKNVHKNVDKTAFSSPEEEVIGYEKNEKAGGLMKKAHRR